MVQDVRSQAADKLQRLEKDSTVKIPSIQDMRHLDEMFNDTYSSESNALNAKCAFSVDVVASMEERHVRSEEKQK